MDEIEPGDRRGTADALDAVDVDPLARGGERLVDELDGLPHELGQHETGITYEEVVQAEVGFDEGERILVGVIKVEDVRDSKVDQQGDILGQGPPALVDPRRDLSGFEGHVRTYKTGFNAASLSD